MFLKRFKNIYGSNLDVFNMSKTFNMYILNYIFKTLLCRLG